MRATLFVAVLLCLLLATTSVAVANGPPQPIVADMAVATAHSQGTIDTEIAGASRNFCAAVFHDFTIGNIDSATSPGSWDTDVPNTVADADINTGIRAERTAASSGLIEQMSYMSDWEVSTTAELSTEGYHTAETTTHVAEVMPNIVANVDTVAIVFKDEDSIANFGQGIRATSTIETHQLTCDADPIANIAGNITSDSASTTLGDWSISTKTTGRFAAADNPDGTFKGDGILSSTDADADTIATNAFSAAAAMVDTLIM